MPALEVAETIQSKHLQNERTIWVYPPRVPAAAPNLVLFLDGEFYLNGVGAMEVWNEFGESIADSWVVFVSHHSTEARWIECPCHPPFAEFVVDELLPWLEAKFAMSAVQRRTLVGLSYTGLAAAYIALRKPGLFGRVICQSGSFWWNDCWLPKQAKSMPNNLTQFYLDVGTKETKTNVQHRADVLQQVSQIEGVRRMRDSLQSSGMNVTYVEFDGGYDFCEWRLTLPKALRWALSSEAG
ncbi:MAG: hypothetical protein SynsKO_14450 [Synoicihabitans sp.]